jgi:hypothetical protein
VACQALSKSVAGETVASSTLASSAQLQRATARASVPPRECAHFLDCRMWWLRGRTMREHPMERDAEGYLEVEDGRGVAAHGGSGDLTAPKIVQALVIR